MGIIDTTVSYVQGLSGLVLIAVIAVLLLALLSATFMGSIGLIFVAVSTALVMRTTGAPGSVAFMLVLGMVGLAVLLQMQLDAGSLFNKHVKKQGHS